MIVKTLLPYVAGGALLAGAGAGYTIRGWQCDAARTDALEKAAEQGEEARNVVGESARTYEAARDQTYRVGATRATEIRTIYREVPVPAADCAAPDSLVGVLQNAVDSANAATTGELGRPVP